MTDDDSSFDDREDSISGRSAALYFSGDPSSAQLLLSHGLRIRELILLSFLSDQGPMTMNRLSRAMNLSPEEVLDSVKQLASAGLVIRDVLTTKGAPEPAVRLTGRGQDIALKIHEQS